jgi:hypothetical protein
MDHCHFGYITKIGRKKTLDRGRGDMPHRPTLGKAGFGPRNSAAPRNKAKQEKGGDKSAALIDIIIVMYIWKLRRHIRRTIASLTRTLFPHKRRAQNLCIWFQWFAFCVVFFSFFRVCVSPSSLVCIVQVVLQQLW